VKPNYAGEAVELFVKFTKKAKDSNCKALLDLCNEMAKVVVPMVVQQAPILDSSSSTTCSTTSSLVSSLFLTLHALGALNLANELEKLIVNLHSMTLVLAPALCTIFESLGKETAKNVTWFVRFREACLKTLHEQINAPATHPADWALDCNASSCQCHDCKLIQKFLRAPQKAKLEMKSSKAQLKHVVEHNAHDDVIYKINSNDVWNFTLIATKERNKWKLQQSLRPQQIELSRVLSQMLYDDDDATQNKNNNNKTDSSKTNKKNENKDSSSSKQKASNKRGAYESDKTNNNGELDKSVANPIKRAAGNLPNEEEPPRKRTRAIPKPVFVDNVSEPLPKDNTAPNRKGKRRVRTNE